MPLRPPGSTRAPFRALRSRPFRLYFGGQVVSASGTFLQQTAIGWLVLKLTGFGQLPRPRRKYLLAAPLAFGALMAATAGAPNVAVACVTLVATGAAAFAFVTLASTTLQLHASAAYRGRIMALRVFVYIGTTPVGTVITGWITSAGAARAALIVGAAACLAAAVLATFVRHRRT
jgi:Transmembrane secretion effector